MPLAEPLAPPVTVIQLAPLVALHPQPAVDDTETLLLPADALIGTLVGVTA